MWLWARRSTSCVGVRMSMLQSIRFKSPFRVYVTALECQLGEILMTCIVSLLIQMAVVRTDDREFFVKIICRAAKGVVVRLLQVLESLDHIVIQASNLTVVGGHINLTSTIHVSMFSFVSLRYSKNYAMAVSRFLFTLESYTVKHGVYCFVTKQLAMN